MRYNKNMIAIKDEKIVKAIMSLAEAFRKGMPTVEEGARRILKRVRDYREGSGNWGFDK